MANETLLTIVGNTTGPAELRFTPSGAAVANFTVASTPRTFDRQANEWKDGNTLFMRVSAWRDMAENIAESLDNKGIRVVVTGRLTQREYEAKDGTKRTVMELEADEVAPSLKYATAKPQRTQRNGNSGGFGGQQAPVGGNQSWGGNQPATQAAGDDPWAAQAGGDPWATPNNDPVPF